MLHPRIGAGFRDIDTPTRCDLVQDLLNDVCLLSKTAFWLKNAIIATRGEFNELFQLTKRPLNIDSLHAASTSTGTRARPESNSGRSVSRRLARERDSNVNRSIRSTSGSTRLDRSIRSAGVKSGIGHDARSFHEARGIRVPVDAAFA